MANDQIQEQVGEATTSSNLIDNAKPMIFDQQNYRIAIVILGILCVLILCLYFFLSQHDKEKSGAPLLTIAATIVGALAGILIPQAVKNN